MSWSPFILLAEVIAEKEHISIG